METKQINVFIICNKYTLLQLGESSLISKVFEVLMNYFGRRKKFPKKGLKVFDEELSKHYLILILERLQHWPGAHVNVVSILYL